MGEVGSGDEQKAGKRLVGCMVFLVPRHLSDSDPESLSLAKGRAYLVRTPPPGEWTGQSRQSFGLRAGDTQAYKPIGLAKEALLPGGPLPCALVLGRVPFPWDIQGPGKLCPQPGAHRVIVPCTTLSVRFHVLGCFTLSLWASVCGSHHCAVMTTK